VYRPARPVARILIASLALIGVIGVFVADFRVQEIQQLTLLRQDPFLVDRPRLALIQHNARALQYPGLAALAGSVLAWLAWQTRCHRNTVPLGGARLRFHSPVAALAAWIVPGANVVLPMVSVRELWTASDPDARPGDRPRRVSPVVLAWWLAFLGFAFLLGGSILHWTGDAGAPAARIVRDEWLIATGLWAVVAAGLAAAVVLLIDLHQEERAQGHVAERWSEWRLQSPS